MDDFIVANLPVVPDGFISLGVDIICIQRDVGQLPPQALGFDLLKCCLANEVTRLEKKQCLVRLLIYSLLQKGTCKHKKLKMR